MSMSDNLSIDVLKLLLFQDYEYNYVSVSMFALSR